MASRSAEHALPQTAKFRTAVALMNRAPAAKFRLILQRVIKNIHKKNTKPFNEDETEQLQEVLEFTGQELSTVLDAAAFIFEQAAYFALRSAALEQQLSSAELQAPQVAAFKNVWETQGREMVMKLKDQSIVPNVMSGVKWQTHLQMAQHNLSRMKEPSAIFQFALSHHEDQDNETEHINVEFSHEELLEFYNKLETIQSQLDSLSHRNR